MAKTLTKTKRAHDLGISRSTLYYKNKLFIKDWELKIKIESVLRDKPSYGHKRLVSHLKIGKAKILRVMKLFGIKPYRRRGKKPWKKADKPHAIYPNLLLSNLPQKANQIWTSDFTHILWKGKVVYLATVLDIFSSHEPRLNDDAMLGGYHRMSDRLARNSVDGGRIIYLIDLGKIRELKFCTFWFEPTPQGKFMLNIAFGQSKYYVDNLSENVKRGLRQKVRRGEYPGVAPTGYLNDKLNHKMIIDPQRFRLVQKLFELYATGYYSLKELREVITKEGLLSRNNKILTYSNIQMLLNNPFFYGAFKFNGELYEGKHQPAIAKKLFDQCQEVMKSRAHPMKRGEKLFVFRNLLKCAECGCSITAEQKFKHQKNGNTHEYIYYRCTKKHGYCSQPFIREELFASEISKEIQKVSLPEDWADVMLRELDKQENDSAQSSALIAQNLKAEIKSCEEKLDVLLDAHLEKTVTPEEYVAKKNKLLARKIEIEQKMKDFERKGDRSLELTRKFILSVKQAKIVSTRDNLEEKRKFFQKLGSNPRLNRREIEFAPRGAWRILADFNSPHQSGGHSGGVFSETSDWLRI